MIILSIVMDGTNYQILAEPTDPLRSVVGHVLEKSGLTCHPVTNTCSMTATATYSIRPCSLVTRASRPAAPSCCKPGMNATATDTRTRTARSRAHSDMDFSLVLVAAVVCGSIVMVCLGAGTFTCGYWAGQRDERATRNGGSGGPRTRYCLLKRQVLVHMRVEPDRGTAR